MRILLAPDSFKQCLSATQAAEAMRRGVKRARPDAEIDCCPAADGGEGTRDALVAATDGTTQSHAVTGPLGELINAAYGRLGDGQTAVIEMAAAGGLHLVPTGRRDPRRTTTYGVGELADHALEAGAKTLLITLGGSGTTDGAAGMLQAMGLACYDESDRLITEPLTGGGLLNVQRIDPAPLLKNLDGCAVRVACDVTNPLTGPNGAAHVYGPQKGADAVAVEELDAALTHWARLIRAATGRDVVNLAGAGAAGGMGAGLVGVLGAELVPGADLVLDAVGFDRRVRGASLCLTGEGMIDGQTRSGKLVMTIAHRAHRAGVPTVALVGQKEAAADALLQPQTPDGLHAIHVVSEGLNLSVDQSITRASELIEATADSVIRRFEG